MKNVSWMKRKKKVNKVNKKDIVSQGVKNSQKIRKIRKMHSNVRLIFVCKHTTALCGISKSTF